MKKDMDLVREMLGPSKYTIQEKSTRIQLDPVDVTIQRVNVPRSIMKFYKEVELLANMIYLNNIPFLISISDNIHYRIVGAL